MNGRTAVTYAIIRENFGLSVCILWTLNPKAVKQVNFSQLMYFRELMYQEFIVYGPTSYLMIYLMILYIAAFL